MSLPKKYARKAKSGLGLQAVWPPGDPVEIGDVFTRSNGIFRPIDNLSSYGIEADLQEFPDQRTLNFEAAGTVTTTIQGGVEVDPTELDASASASVEITFSRSNSYFVRTSELTGIEIENVRRAVQPLLDAPDWKFGRYHIAWQLYTAKNFTFLGTQQKNKTVTFGGKGNAILKFLRLGVTAGLSRASSGSMTVDITGKKGPIAMALIRLRKNGEVVFV